MKTPPQSLLRAFQIFIAICLTWQGMNEAYKLDETRYVNAIFLLITGFGLLLVGVVGVVRDVSK